MTRSIRERLPDSAALLRRLASLFNAAIGRRLTYKELIA